MHRHPRPPAIFAIFSFLSSQHQNVSPLSLGPYQTRRFDCEKDKKKDREMEPARFPPPMSYLACPWLEVTRVPQGAQYWEAVPRLGMTLGILARGARPTNIIFLSITRVRTHQQNLPALRANKFGWIS